MPPTRRSSTLAKQAVKRRIIDEEDEDSHDDVAPSVDDQPKSESIAVDSKPKDKDDPTEMDVDEEDSDSRSASVANSSSQAGGKQASALKVRLKLGRSKGKQQRPAPEPSPEEDEIEDEEEGEGAEDDVESEDDSDDEDDDSSSDEVQKSTAPLTARQAALAGVSEGKGPHISLDEVTLGQRRRGPQKTAEEIEAKRHEAAKKRKLQMDQKVKNEKRDAVDRLLKKQAPRPRASRRNTNTGYNTPIQPSGTQTPSYEVPETRSTSPDGDGSGSGRTSQTPSQAPTPSPTTFRWISSSRNGTNASRTALITMIDGPQDEATEKSGIEMNVDAPSQVETSETGHAVSETAAPMDVEKGDANTSGPFVPAEPSVTGSLSTTDEGGTVHSEVSATAQPAKTQPAPSLSFTLAIPPSLLLHTTDPSIADAPVPVPPRQCGVEGCSAGRKYRVVCGGGVEKGACGLDHFKILKQSSSAVAV
ncbi:hypothetical protein FRC03_010869 [Tulasnella sp. 419]|nr:hypothetical protein FRC03_010869 [Tulasnella sp. 419]